MADKTKAEEIAEDLKEIEKELESEKETSNILGEDSDLQQEKKTYINFICCQLSV